MLLSTCKYHLVRAPKWCVLHLFACKSKGSSSAFVQQFRTYTSLPLPLPRMCLKLFSQCIKVFCHSLPFLQSLPWNDIWGFQKIRRTATRGAMDIHLHPFTHVLIHDLICSMIWLKLIRFFSVVVSPKPLGRFGGRRLPRPYPNVAVNWWTWNGWWGSFGGKHLPRQWNLHYGYQIGVEWKGPELGAVVV